MVCFLFHFLELGYKKTNNFPRLITDEMGAALREVKNFKHRNQKCLERMEATNLQLYFQDVKHRAKAYINKLPADAKLITPKLI